MFNPLLDEISEANEDIPLAIFWTNEAAVFF